MEDVKKVSARYREGVVRVQNSFELVMVKGTWKSTRLDKIEIISSCTKPTELNESSKVSK